jgi:hypothetical protein
VGLVTQAVLEAIEKRRYEITVPRHSPSLLLARALGVLCPPLLRAGLRRMDPLPAPVLERARARAYAAAGAASQASKTTFTAPLDS